jgi:hypothetical protein
MTIRRVSMLSLLPLLFTIVAMADTDDPKYFTKGEPKGPAV